MGGRDDDTEITLGKGETLMINPVQYLPKNLVQIPDTI